MLPSPCVLPSTALASLSLSAKKLFTSVLLLIVCMVSEKSLPLFCCVLSRALVFYLFEEFSFVIDRTQEINGLH